MLIIAFIAIGIVLFKLFTSIYFTKNPDKLINHYFENKTVRKYPCHLFATMVFNSDFEGYSYDFSEYDNKSNIYYIVYKKEKVPDELAEYIGDSNMRTIYLSNQIVCLMKDGTYQWDIRWEL